MCPGPPDINVMGIPGDKDLVQKGGRGPSGGFKPGFRDSSHLPLSTPEQPSVVGPRNTFLVPATKVMGKQTRRQRLSMSPEVASEKQVELSSHVEGSLITPRGSAIQLCRGLRGPAEWGGQCHHPYVLSLLPFEPGSVAVKPCLGFLV